MDKKPRGRPNTLNSGAPRPEQPRLNLMCPDGKRHPVRKIGNIFQVLKKGKMVTGTVEGDNFIPYPEGLNAHVFDPRYKTRKGFIVGDIEYSPTINGLPEIEPVVEVRTLWDVAQSGGELALSVEEVTKLSGAIHMMADLCHNDCNLKNVARNLTRLHKADKVIEALRLVQVKPEIHLKVTGGFQSNLTDLVNYFNRKS